jgi:hypothetical protein
MISDYWAIRFCNVSFWIHLFVAVSSPVFAYYGITPKDLKTWKSLWDFLKEAMSNPYIVGLIIINVINTVNDPKTPHLSD